MRNTDAEPLFNSFVARALREPWQPILLGMSYSLGDLAKVCRRFSSGSDELRNVLASRWAEDLGIEVIDGKVESVWAQFLYAAVWEHIEARKPLMVKTHDVLHGILQIPQFCTESALWYWGVARSFMSWYEWRFEQEKAALAREENERVAILERRVSVLKAEKDGIFREFGVPSGTTPNWPDSDPRHRRLAPVLDEIAAAGSEVKRLQYSIAERDRWMDYEFRRAGVPGSRTLLRGWLASKQYRLSERAVSYRLSPWAPDTRASLRCKW